MHVCPAADAVSCFGLVRHTTRDPIVTGMALAAGKPLAHRWLSLSAGTPLTGNPDQALEWAQGILSCDLLGVRDRNFERRAASQMHQTGTTELLGFDPAAEAPPTNVPQPCRYGHRIGRGHRICGRCRRKLRMENRYWLWHYGLVAAHTYASFGLRRRMFSDVVRWIDIMRPYPPASDYGSDDHFESLYAVAHLVFALADYGRLRVLPRGLEPEIAHLVDSLEPAVSRNHWNSVGEIVSALRWLGEGRRREVRDACDELLVGQRGDGCWIDGQIDDPTRWHATWAVVDALRAYRPGSGVTSLKRALAVRK